jgi:DNA repair protein RadC
LLTLATPRRDCKQQARELLEKQGASRRCWMRSRRLLAAVKGSRTQEHTGPQADSGGGQRYMTSKLIQQSQPVDRDAGGAFPDATVAQKGVLHGGLSGFGPPGAKKRMLGRWHREPGWVYPREVVAKALAWQARRTGLRPQPSQRRGQPSEDDEALTRQLVHACCVVGA